MSEKGNRKPNEHITRDLMTKVEAEALARSGNSRGCPAFGIDEPVRIQTTSWNGTKTGV